MTLSHGIPGGPFSGSCAHMAYLPRSAMTFPTDLHHDFQSFQLDHRLDTIADWASFASETYLNAAQLLDVLTHPIADCLRADPLFDARTMWVCHDLMAAHWRFQWLKPALAGKPFTPSQGYRVDPLYTYTELHGAFHKWPMLQTAHWAKHFPHMIRLICLAVAGDHSTTGQRYELELLAILIDTYPLRKSPP